MGTGTSKVEPQRLARQIKSSTSSTRRSTRPPQTEAQRTLPQRSIRSPPLSTQQSLTQPSQQQTQPQLESYNLKYIITSISKKKEIIKNLYIYLGNKLKNNYNYRINKECNYKNLNNINDLIVDIYKYLYIIFIIYTYLLNIIIKENDKTTTMDGGFNFFGFFRKKEVKEVNQVKTTNNIYHLINNNLKIGKKYKNRLTDKEIYIYLNIVIYTYLYIRNIVINKFFNCEDIKNIKNIKR
jgi:hypothetical protein